jgi:hypothetical protein
MSDLYDEAVKAAARLFEDTSVSPQEAIRNLNALVDEIWIFIEALESERNKMKYKTGDIVEVEETEELKDVLARLSGIRATQSDLVKMHGLALDNLFDIIYKQFPELDDYHFTFGHHERAVKVLGPREKLENAE